MVRKIFKTGNSLVVSLSKEAIEFLQVAEGSEVNVELDRKKRQIVITPAEPALVPAGIDAEFVQQIADFITEYRPALEKLAKQ